MQQDSHGDPYSQVNTSDLRPVTKYEDNKEVKFALNQMRPILNSYAFPPGIHNHNPDPKKLLQMRGLKYASVTMS